MRPDSRPVIFKIYLYFKITVIFFSFRFFSISFRPGRIRLGGSARECKQVGGVQGGWSATYRKNTTEKTRSYQVRVGSYSSTSAFLRPPLFPWPPLSFDRCFSLADMCRKRGARSGFWVRGVARACLVATRTTATTTTRRSTSTRCSSRAGSRSALRTTT